MNEAEGGLSEVTEELAAYDPQQSTENLADDIDL